MARAAARRGGLSVRTLQPSDLGPTLTTERLILRPPCEADLDGWAKLYADPDRSRWIGGPEPRMLVWRRLMSHVGSWAVRGYAMFSVLDRETGAWLGFLGPWKPDGWPGNEIGWGMARAAEGRGYASEGATAAMDWAFESLGWTDVIHTINAGNDPSIRLAERLGSRRLGPIELPQPSAKDAIAWGQSREDWRARRRAGLAVPADQAANAP